MMYKRYCCIVEAEGGNESARMTHDDLTEIEQFAARNVHGSYKVAHVYERVKMCRAELPKVEWADDRPALLGDATREVDK